MRIGILISGRGSNMLALDDAVRNRLIPDCQIAIVISDKKRAAGLARAQERGLPTLVFERRGISREEHDRAIVAALKEHQVELVCLAGYMRLLSPVFINSFPDRILNIHPSLLPAFPGLDAQQQALEHGVKWTGCTVHLVDDSLDGGPIVAQRIVPVLPEDTVETLSERILEQEHQLYPEALALIASGNYDVVGRIVVIKN
jgi:phosphoribosylglycinamide formyltransferase-1